LKSGEDYRFAKPALNFFLSGVSRHTQDKASQFPQERNAIFPPRNVSEDAQGAEV